MLRDARAPTVDHVNKYMVERYLPGITARQLDEASTRLAAAATELAAQGVEVRYISSTFIPAEESCFCNFEAPDEAGVHRACDLAGISYARIVETHDFPRRTEV